MQITESELARMIAQEMDAKAVLAGFLDADASARAAAMMALRPRPDDYQTAFTGPAVEPIRAQCERLWMRAKPPALGDRRVLLIKTTPSEALHQDRNWPGGYRKLEGVVAPGLIWHAWKFVAEGERSGLQFDALTRIDDRFVWFPKPFRAL